MDKKYWDDIVPQHSEKIFDVFVNDKKKVIQSAIRKYFNPKQSALDLGCAVGKWLPLLSSVSKKVYAVDIAKMYLEIAEERHSHLTNIEYVHADLSKPGKKIPACDMVVCINTLLTDHEKRRNAIFDAVVKTVKKNGYLVLVVPSLESALLSKIVLKHWDLLDGTPVEKFSANSKENALSGIIELDGTPTKHFLREELMFLLQNAGFEIKETEKVEYTWNTEFNSPPVWMKAPYPGDWLVVARKK